MSEENAVVVPISDPDPDIIQETENVAMYVKQIVDDFKQHGVNGGTFFLVFPKIAAIFGTGAKFYSEQDPVRRADYCLELFDRMTGEDQYAIVKAVIPGLSLTDQEAAFDIAKRGLRGKLIELFTNMMSN